MASGKRASMREGPLAQLFRKTEEDDARPEQKPRQEERAPEQEPKLGRPLPEGGPSPQVTRHVPEPQGQTEMREERGEMSQRMTEAAKRAQEREERRAERREDVLAVVPADDRAAGDVDGVALRLHVLVEVSQDRVVLQQVGEGLVVGQIIDGDDLDVGT